MLPPSVVSSLFLNHVCICCTLLHVVKQASSLQASHSGHDPRAANPKDSLAACVYTASASPLPHKPSEGRGRRHLGSQLFLSGSEMDLQLLLQALQDLAVQLLQACQSSRDALRPGANTLHQLYQRHAHHPFFLCYWERRDCHYTGASGEIGSGMHIHFAHRMARQTRCSALGANCFQISDGV